MKQKLHIAERLTLLKILPKEGNFLTLKSIRKLRESLSLNEQELKKYNVVQTGDQVTWNAEVDKTPAEIEITDFCVDLIKSKLTELDKQNKLEDEQFSVYEKFIEKGD